MARNQLCTPAPADVVAGPNPFTGRLQNDDDSIASGGLTDTETGDNDSGDASGDSRRRPRRHMSVTTKRLLHNQSERRRRECLNAQFQKLIEAVPSLARLQRPPKAVVIDHCIQQAYEVRHLRRLNNQYKWLVNQLNIDPQQVIQQYRMQQHAQNDPNSTIELGLLASDYSGDVAAAAAAAATAGDFQQMQVGQAPPLNLQQAQQNMKYQKRHEQQQMKFQHDHEDELQQQQQQQQQQQKQQQQQMKFQQGQEQQSQQQDGQSQQQANSHDLKMPYQHSHFLYFQQQYMMHQQMMKKNEQQPANGAVHLSCGSLSSPDSTISSVGRSENEERIANSGYFDEPVIVQDAGITCTANNENTNAYVASLGPQGNSFTHPYEQMLKSYF